jgi:hypothetical protein
MESVKAKIKGEGIDSSVEFSVEEMITQHRGKPWREMSGPERQDAMKDYALLLFSRDSGVVSAGDFDISLEGGTFSKTENGAA